MFYSSTAPKIIDPMHFVRVCWPDIELYDKQVEILYSLRDNDETVVPAGNALGKDFISALAALWFFCSRRPARIVTTSVKADQLNDVLWGELRRFIETSAVELPIKYNHMKIRQKRNNGSLVPLCELVGQVVNKGEAMLGRHLPRDIPRTLCIFDEASGIDDAVYETSDTWAHRKLIIGNPYPCTNFFYKGVKEGDRESPVDSNLFRKVIKIKAEDSPNVRLGLAQVARGETPTNEILVPGVIDYNTYVKRREIWDKIRQTIGLDAEFYEGAEVLLFPPAWLDDCERYARKIKGMKRYAKAMGVDSASGGDYTAWYWVDEHGVLGKISMKTPDTSVIVPQTIALIRELKIDASKVLFDLGGGGKEHADLLRSKGFKVKTIGFGTPASNPKIQRRSKTIKERVEETETRYAYKNRRAEMYGMLRSLIDPALNDGKQFAISEDYTDLRHQLSPIPLLFDKEGRLYLPPKNKQNPNSEEVTMTELCGRSPDDADALVLAVYSMHYRGGSATAGAVT